jgi:hypothetical protein
MVNGKLSMVKVLAIILLMLNGVGACFGGFSMMADPSGGGIKIPLEWLQHSPFDDFLIPGIVLFVMNGLSSFFVLALLLFNIRRHQLLVIFQGVILFGWITVQVLMVRQLYWLHFACWGMAIAIMICGWILLAGAKKRIRR